jgi:RHS repeat-associated protein
MKKLLYPYFIPYLFLFAAVIGLEGSPYAPERILGGPDGELTYTYNIMGQRLENGLSGRSKQTIEWGLIDKPVKIIKGINKRPDDYVEFSYGPGGQRYLRKDKDGSKTYYVGDMEYRVAEDGTSQSVYYIRNGGYSPVAMVSTSGGTSEYTYFLRDHVGSSVVAVDDEANAIEGSSHGHHDPWGQPWSADGSKNELKEDSRGFTGHENIASVGLIHMNGRVYDPMIGLFLGPDQFLQNAHRTVGLNRYAYIGNSPVNGSDPSGWVRETIELLSEKEYNAVRSYVGTNSNNFKKAATLNPHNPEALIEEHPHLLTGEPIKAKFKLKDLDSALEKLREHQKVESLTTYSGVSAGDYKIDWLHGWQDGEIRNYREYISTSKNQHKAATFASKKVRTINDPGIKEIYPASSMGPNKEIMLEIKATHPRGAHVEEFSAHKMEKEFLYMRNTSFVKRGESFHQSRDRTIRMLSLEQLPEPTFLGNSVITPTPSEIMLGDSYSSFFNDYY